MTIRAEPEQTPEHEEEPSDEEKVAQLLEDFARVTQLGQALELSLAPRERRRHRADRVVLAGGGSWGAGENIRNCECW